MGMDTIGWFAGSGVGVMMAAITKASTIAQRRNLLNLLGVAMPSLESKKTITGVSNAIPTASRKVVTKLRNSEIVGLFTILLDPKLSRKFSALGSTRK